MMVMAVAFPLAFVGTVMPVAVGWMVMEFYCARISCSSGQTVRKKLVATYATLAYSV